MQTRRPSLVELRVLDGANLYFPGPAVKLTLDLTTLVDAGAAATAATAEQLGLSGAHPGPTGGAPRLRFAATVVTRLLRRIAQEAGVSRLEVRSRLTGGPRRLVVAFPWHHRERAEALGHALAGAVDALPSDDVCEVVRAAAVFVRGAEQGEPPPTRRPTVPVVSVTGTNGKTTTTRMVARMGLEAGLCVGWSSTDGVQVGGRMVEAGDHSGPDGAARVLDDPQVELAVAETARGSILRRGLGVAHNDVSVVTNVGTHDLGRDGVDTLDQLAEVRAVVTRDTKPEGWVVLGGDDPRPLAMRLATPARPCVFSRDPDAPALRSALAEGGRAVTVVDGTITVLEGGADPDPLLAVADVPATLAGLCRVNLENALAATGAGLAVGLPRQAVIAGLRGFRADPADNPGRMNVYDLHGVTVVVDQAHDSAGAAALLEVMVGLRAPGRSTRLVLATPGSGGAGAVRALGERCARGADVVVLARSRHRKGGLRPDEVIASLRQGAAAAGRPEVEACPTELDALQLLVSGAVPGDVVGVMCHGRSRMVDLWLRGHGAAVDGPEEVRAKALAAHG